ncbi:long-chain-fatty-acid-CoA ligase [Agrocybe pediades]|nr:long-chain-fatty-acid-CoA ligase [Agrocybe pediades]
MLRSLAETERLLTAPGSVHEVETALVDGRLQRVYKNLWPSLREFWLSAVSQYKDDTYIVYEDQRLTYAQVHARATKVAALFSDVYNIKKGDRVAICSRNCPDYLVAFWACHLIGAVSVLANAWLPLKPLSHCLAHTQCKLIILDPERADVLQSEVSRMCRESQVQGFLVFDLKDNTRRWEGIMSFGESLDGYHMDGLDKTYDSIVPEDNATVIFTSGTTGLPKGVLSTQRQFLTNVLNVLVGGFRAALRRGDDFPTFQRTGVQKATLVAVPLFHVTGSTSFSMMATMTGMKIVMSRRWQIDEAIRLIKAENVSVAGGVPSMVTDLILSPLAKYPLEGLLFGGAPAPDTLVRRAMEAFPTATMIQGYGLTETNSIAVSFAGEDYVARPASTGRASPVNDIRIVLNDVCLAPNAVGEVWLRGPNVMKGYWRDPDATDAVITKDGWLKTGDVGYLDDEGFLYIKDRLKDIIIRGGENIDSVTVENALYADPRVLEAAAVGVPDERLGELVTAVVSVRPEFQGQVTEDALIAHAKSLLPKFAVPVMVVLLDAAFERTPSGKIVKGELRKIAKAQWKLRRQGGNGREPLANL